MEIERSKTWVIFQHKPCGLTRKEVDFANENKGLANTHWDITNKKQGLTS